MNTSPRPRRLRPFAPAGVLVACAALGGLVPAVAHAASLADLERQLALATDAREPGSVRELARRLTAIDPTPERQLRLAETFLTLGLHADLGAALDSASAASPGPVRVIDKLRAQSAAAQGDWIESRERWEAYLRPATGLPPAERVTALDELVRVLVHEHEWQAARTRLDERLALADASQPRLTRATVSVRLRRWPQAREDFEHLQRVASDDEEVKPFLPRWERVDRLLPELLAGDRALDAAPAALDARLARGRASLRAGLWQNAAEDLAVAEENWPMTREPKLLLALLVDSDSIGPRRAGLVGSHANALPVLAASDAVIRRNDPIDDLRDTWQALRDCDARLAAAPDPASLPGLRAEQARLVCAFGFHAWALEDARTILHQSPGFLPAQRVEIAALAAQHRWVEADARVAAARQRQPDADGDAELQRLAGLVWQAQGKHPEAIAAFTAALGVTRTSELLRARARSLRSLQRLAEAADDLAAAENLEAAPAGKTP